MARAGSIMGVSIVTLLSPVTMTPGMHQLFWTFIVLRKTIKCCLFSFKTSSKSKLINGRWNPMHSFHWEVNQDWTFIIQSVVFRVVCQCRPYCSGFDVSIHNLFQLARHWEVIGYLLKHDASSFISFVLRQIDVAILLIYRGLIPCGIRNCELF